MTKDPLYEQLRQISWRRKLTPSEQASLAAWLAAHPQAQGEWESEAALNEALSNLPHVPVATNFTARVVAEAQRHAASSKTDRQGSGWPIAWWPRWVPRTAFAAAAVGLALLSYSYVRQERRAEVAHSLATLSKLPAVPGPEILKDFDTIAALTSTPPADEELLKVMQ